MMRVEESELRSELKAKQPRTLVLTHTFHVNWTNHRHEVQGRCSCGERGPGVRPETGYAIDVAACWHERHLNLLT